MPVSIGVLKEIISLILNGKSPPEIISKLQLSLPKNKPLSHSIPFETSLEKTVIDKRIEILKKQGINLNYVTEKKKIENFKQYEGNIENFVGFAKVPIGVIGPLRINGIYANGDFYVPLATTEGSLVASYNRGAKIISYSGGARVMCLTERLSRAPGFRFANLIEVGEFLIWIVSKFDKFKRIVKTTTKHGRLEDMSTTIEGNLVILNFEYTTGDASGQNIVTIATDKICKYIVKNSPIKPKIWFIESNLSGDKKATSMSYLFVRGKKVTAEVVVPREYSIRMLHAKPEIIMDYYKMSVIGAVQSGSLGTQGHYANGLAGIFIACGQDVACVSEAAIGITRIDITENGDLYFSVTIPNLIIGTVGGGTALPTQKECLKMLGCSGNHKAKIFAEICAATLLGGEISIIGAIASGEFTEAHKKYGRKLK
ncbi:hydroxymethylglutaryl-CoA reductase [candidate division WOR-3 bacterium]|nr:hydroxymethylglutaryl-CoA reductase [candidate division WOR-3 bacterium]